MSSKNKTKIPAPTAEERALRAKQVELADAQLAAIRQQTQLQEQLFGTTGELAGLQTNILKQLVEAQNDPRLKQLQDIQLQQAIDMAPIQQELMTMQLDALRRGGAASPEQLELIRASTDAALQAGPADIDAATEEAMRQLRDELAPQLGLLPTDTPILDRGGVVAREGVRQKSQLSTALRGAEATARLNFPLAQQQALAGINTAAQGIGLATQEFQARLREAALAKRMQLAGAVGQPFFSAAQLGLGLATGSPGAGAIASAADAMTQARFGSATTKQSGFGVGTVMQGIGAVGGLMQGLDALSAASSRKLKEEVAKVDENEILEDIKKLPVSVWTYKHDDQREAHIGPFAEDFRQLFGLGDGKSINIIDALGVLFAASRALAKRIEAMKGQESEPSAPAPAGIGLAAA